MGVHCLAESLPPLFILLAISSMLLIFLLSRTHLFTYFLSSFLICLNPSFYLSTLLFFFSLTLSLTYSKMVLVCLQSHFLPLLSTSLPLSVSIPFIITLYSMSSSTFSLFFFVVCVPFHSCVRQCSDSISLVFISHHSSFFSNLRTSHTVSLCLTYFFIPFFLSPSLLRP